MPDRRKQPHPISRVISALKDFFVSNNIEAYFVGGLVRDSLLGRETQDLDVAVKGDARACARSLATRLDGQFFDLDAERDIVRVVLSGSRKNFYIDISTIEGDILTDLARRDFTVNSMAIPVGKFELTDIRNNLIDPFDGMSDLEKGVIRTVGESVFRDDPVRLVRAARLSVQASLDIDQETADRIQREAHLVNNVAPERIRDEFLKLLALPGVTDSIRMLDSLGLLTAIIPEMELTRHVEQPGEHYWDVFNHMVEAPGRLERMLSDVSDDDVVTSGLPRFNLMNEYFGETMYEGHTRLTVLKLACLLHDIAKPQTKTVEKSGRIRFLGHHIKGAETAGTILRRLRFSRRGKASVKTMVRHHLRPGQMAPKGKLPSKRAVFRYYRDVGEVAVDTLYLNLADYLAARGPRLEPDDWAHRCRTIQRVLDIGAEQKKRESLPRLLDGKDLMSDFGLEPGPVLGDLLRLVDEARALGKIETREQAIELVRSNLVSGEGNA